MDDQSSDSSRNSDEERITIRDDLKSLSMEELLKLKEKVGMKYYSSCVLKSSSSKSDARETLAIPKKQKYKRLNKNRPREESSKIPVRSVHQPTRKEFSDDVGHRDPRFDSLCGEFNEWAYSNNYWFIHDLRKEEVSILEKNLKKTKDPEKKSKIQLALSRLKNQVKSRKVKEDKNEERSQSRKNNIELIKSGMKPQFRSKGDEKAMKLVDQYEKLKSKGKLEKYMKKKNKELSSKSRTELPF